MQFYRPPKRRAEVPIIPLIDLLVTLLFFFIVSMAPKQRRSLLEVTLPNSETLKVATSTEAVSVLSVNASGRVDLDGLEIPEGLVKEYLVAGKSEGTAASSRLEIRMDQGCTLQTLLEVQAAVAEAGYEKGQVYHRVRQGAAE